MAQLHPILPDNELPPALRRPLRFGDLDQIKALRVVDSRIGEMIAEADADGCDVSALRRYRVTVTVEGEYEETVLASSREAAVKKVKDDFDRGLIDDFDVSYHAMEVKKCETPA